MEKQPNTQIVRGPLGSMLVEDGLITPDQLDLALFRQKQTGTPLGQVMLELGFVDGMELVRVLADQRGLDCITVNQYVLDPRALSMVPQEVAADLGFIPLIKLGPQLLIALPTSDDFPARVAAIQERLHMRVEAIRLRANVELIEDLDVAYSMLRRKKGHDKRIGEHLMHRGFLTQSQLDQALDRQRRSGLRFGEVLISLDLIDEPTFYQALSDWVGLPYVNQDQLLGELDRDVARVIPREFAEHNLLLPIRKSEDSVTVATTRILDPWLEEYLQATTHRRKCELILSTDRNIRQAIRAAWEAELDLELFDESAPASADVVESPRTDIDEDTFAPAVVDNLLETALSRGVSDIHIEQYPDEVVVRFRIDGQLIAAPDLHVDRSTVARVVSRIKLEAELDISERRRPQDGSYRRTFDGGRQVDFRVSVAPTPAGENVVIRVLDRTKPLPPINKIGFTDDVRERYTRLIQNPQGMILFTGPTGSGKTTSLYATLSHLREKPVKIVTAEDPIEINFKGIQQSQVSEAIGNTFSRFLRVFLRQDPDIILVGEIRDRQTAEVAVEAAMTGHLLFSTLHTNDTVGTVARLINMGLEPDQLANTLLCVVSQRLIRTICPDCKTDYLPSETDAEEFYPMGMPEDVVFSQGVGCESCEQTGYKGRIPVFEFWEIDDEARKLIQQSGGEVEMRKAAHATGMRSLIEDAIEKVEAGITTFEALRAVVPFSQIKRYRDQVVQAWAFSEEMAH